MLVYARRTLDEALSEVPVVALINRIDQLHPDFLTVYAQKRLGYDATFSAPSGTDSLVRILIVQSNLPEDDMGRVPTSEELFGSYYPSIAGPIMDQFKVISDRTFFVQLSPG